MKAGRKTFLINLLLTEHSSSREGVVLNDEEEGCLQDGFETATDVNLTIVH